MKQYHWFMTEKHLIMMNTTMELSDERNNSEDYSLYILALLEHIQKTSNNEAYEKAACEIIIKQLEDRVSLTKLSVSNNDNDFIPGFLVYMIAVELAKLDINQTILFDILYDSDYIWIDGIDELTEIKINVLENVVKHIKNDYYRANAQIAFSRKLFEHGMDRKAIECAKSIKNEGERIRAILSLAFDTGLDRNCKIQLDLIEEAITIARKMDSTDEYSGKSHILTEISEKLSENHVFSRAVEVLSESDYVHKDDCFEHLSTALIENEEYELALKAINEVSDPYRLEEFQKQLALGFAKKGDIEKAESLALKINDEYDRNDIIEAIIVSTSKTGANSRVGALIDHLSEYKIDDTYKAVVSSLCKYGFYEEAINFEFRKDFYETDAYEETLEIIAIALSKNGEAIKALELLQRMHPESYRRSNVIPDLFFGLVEQGHVDLASSYIYPEGNVFEKCKWLAYLSTAYFNLGMINKSKDAWKEVEELTEHFDLTQQNDSVFQAISFLSASSAELGKQGLLENAEEVFEGAIDLFFDALNNQSDYYITDELNVFFDRLYHFKKNDVIKGIIEVTDGRQKNHSILSSLVSWLINHNQIIRVGEILNVSENDALRLSVIENCLERNNTETALLFADKLLNQEDKEGVLQAIAMNLFKDGRYKEAREIVAGFSDLEEIQIDYAEKFIKVNHFEDAINCIYLINKDTNKKRELIHRVVDLWPQIPESEIDEITKHYMHTISDLDDKAHHADLFYKKAAALYAGKLRFSKANNLSDKITSHIIKKECIKNVAHEYTKRGVYDQVRLIILKHKEMPNNIDLPDDSFLNALSISFIKDDYLDLSLKTAEQISHRRIKFACYREIAESLLQTKRFNEAKTPLINALDEIKEFDEKPLKNAELASLARDLINYDFFDLVMIIVNELDYFYYNESLSICDQLIKKGDNDLALQVIAKTFISYYPQSILFGSIKEAEFAERLNLIVPRETLGSEIANLLNPDKQHQLNLHISRFTDVGTFDSLTRSPVKFICSLLFALVKNNLNDLAHKLVESIEEIEEDENRTELLAGVSKVFVLLGEGETAQKIIDKILTLIDSNNNPEEQIASLKLLLKICGKEAANSKSLTVLNNALSKFDLTKDKVFLRIDEAELLMNISSAFFFAGQKEKADKVLSFVQENVSAPHFIEEKLVNEMFDQGKYTQALEFSGNSDDHLLRIKSLCRLGKYHEAIRGFLDIAKDKGGFNSIPGNIITCLLIDNRFDLAVDLTKKISGKDILPPILAYITLKMVESGRLQEARELTQLMENHHDTLSKLAEQAAYIKEYAFSEYVCSQIQNQVVKEGAIRRMLEIIAETDSEDCFIDYFKKQKNQTKHISILVSYCFKHTHQEGLIKAIRYVDEVMRDNKTLFLKEVWGVLLRKECYLECLQLLRLYPNTPISNEEVAYAMIKLGLFNDAIEYILKNRIAHQTIEKFIYSTKVLFNELAGEVYRRNGINATLSTLECFKSEPERTCFINGIISVLNPINATKDTFCSLIDPIRNDVKATKQLYLMHILHLVFFSEIKDHDKQIYSGVFNIDWAIEISKRVRQL